MAASRGVDALDTFVFHHSQIALVLANARLPDFRGAQLVDALYRIDTRVPVITARHPAHRLDSSAANRWHVFVDLIAEVDRRVFHTAGDRFASDHRHGVLSWPVRDEELDEIEGLDDTFDTPDSSRHASWPGWPDSGDLLEPVTASGDALLSIKPREIRNYLAAQHAARRSRLRRIGRAAALVVILAAIAVTMLMQLRPTSARANEADGPNAPARSEWPAAGARLATQPVTDRIGTVRLIAAERVSPRLMAAEYRVRPSRRPTSRR